MGTPRPNSGGRGTAKLGLPMSGLAIFSAIVSLSSVLPTLAMAEEQEPSVQDMQRACLAGETDMCVELGEAYYEGKGVPQDLSKAVEWYRKGAEQGDATAQFYLAFSYASGEGVPEDLGKAVEWYRKAAEQGDAFAQYALGWSYANGLGVSQDYVAAVEWYRKAAEQGLAEAQTEMGWHFAEGAGLPQDYAKAVEWTRKAAAQGSVSAQYNLGLAYAGGQGVAQDYAASVEWFRKAAEQGDAAAQYALGLSYAQGLGVEADPAKANELFGQSCTGGFEEACDVLEPSVEDLLAAPADAIAQGYLVMETRLALMAMIDGTDFTLQTPEGEITKGSADFFRQKFEGRKSLYRQAIEQRGYPDDLAGKYDVASVEPSCRQSESPFISEAQRKSFSKVRISQNDHEIVATILIVEAPEYDGTEEAELSFDGVVIESSLALFDSLNGYHYLVGKIGSQTIELRPSEEERSQADPSGEPDLNSCVVILERAP